MAQTPQDGSDSNAVSNLESGTTAPQLNLPKGGGAVRGIGEKYTANPVTGTGSLSVPLAVSPGRSGFGPQLSVTYDSGSGNGPFGIGWNLPLPSITRKTDKGLPRYDDAKESDVFILSGVEDLVPAFKMNSEGGCARDEQDSYLYDEETRHGYVIKRYRPRIEGLFARIERWSRVIDGDVHWRTISKNNVLTVYGVSPQSRVADPDSPLRVFSWLICQSYDDRGNAIAYDYVAENDEGVDRDQANERNRGRSAARYIKRIRYGNTAPILHETARQNASESIVSAHIFDSVTWTFEIVFDYGEGHYAESCPDSDGRIFATASVAPSAHQTWPARPDPFSTYRACFEIRNYRLCRRVLMFHRFPAELGVDDYLVRSTEFLYLEKPTGSFIAEIVQSGFTRIEVPEPRYLKGSLPPLAFGYSVSPLLEQTYDTLPLQELDDDSLQNLPEGIDGSNYRWVDLDGEGISGVLSEQPGTWLYKPNLGEGHFGALQITALRPSLAALNRGSQQLLDLAGNGNLDLVDFNGPAPGFYARTMDAAWERFRTFLDLPNIAWRDPNLRLVDLTGDGRADVLITEDLARFTWHECYGEDGFGPGNRVWSSIDEDRGPRLVFSDGTDSIYLADMSGDGMSDLVRIRQGEVCYWPNLGYGRFGARVTMDNAPWFEEDNSFDQHRLHLADTDGSGPTDIIYVGRDAVSIYLNEHGNSFSAVRRLTRVPHTDKLTSISVVDFLGRGTACLLWSSPLPHDSRRPIRYLDLMAGTKPNVLTLVRNNIGAETHFTYASSTHFYLADKAAGNPWVTRLPFPVHVVTRVETIDSIGGNRFITRYAYHHGYFDGIEREFRGFGRVDQWDSEEFGVLVPAAGPAANTDAAFRLPPVLTKTWFHTGVDVLGTRIWRRFQDEYFREGGADCGAHQAHLAQWKALLLDETSLPRDLPADEVREAIRSLKGNLLRQEIYALDNGTDSSRPYSVSERNYTIRMMQPRGDNLHSVFFTHGRETIDLQYERSLFPVVNGRIVSAATAAADQRVRWYADPRVKHALTLDVDEFGNVRRSTAIAYGRRFSDGNPAMTDDDRRAQKKILATMTDATFTNAIRTNHSYRAPQPAEVKTYELLNLCPQSIGPEFTALFKFSEIAQTIRLADDGERDIPYEDINEAGVTGPGPYRRLIEHRRIHYRSNDLTHLLPLRSIQSLALPGEAYELAFTPGLLSSVYRRSRAGHSVENLLPEPASVLANQIDGGSYSGGYVDLDGDGRWWMPSGRVFYHERDAATPGEEVSEGVRHFFRPRRYQNPFGFSSYVSYAYDLLPARTRDALGNAVEVQYDYRVLQPNRLTDPNGNLSFACYDAIGLLVATAVHGKESETLGDSLAEFSQFDSDPNSAALQSFFANPQEQAALLLKGATSRIVYDLDRYRRCGEPPITATIARETHVSEGTPPGGLQTQVNLAYSDGFGRLLQSKIQAAPGQAPRRASAIRLPSGDVKPGALLTSGTGELELEWVRTRWIGKGRTVYNNKGHPVKQYEPFFSSTHLYEPEPEMTETGVTPIMVYDPLGRVVVTLHPNCTYDKVVFDPWRRITWDVNDTVLEPTPQKDPDIGHFIRQIPTAELLPTWFDRRKNGQLGPLERAAAEKAARHAATPTVAYFDTLGRTFLTIVDNGLDSSGAAQHFPSRILADIQGYKRQARDSHTHSVGQGRIVMRYDYDMLGNLIHQVSMDAGERWMLGDVAGHPIRSWDARGHNFQIYYDALRRPTYRTVLGTDATKSDPRTLRGPVAYERTDYGEGQFRPELLNLRTRVYALHDSASTVENRAMNPITMKPEAYDFKGNLLRSSRRIVKDYKALPDWRGPPPDYLEEIFTTNTSFDALNRAVRIAAPDGSVLYPTFDKANLLQQLKVKLSGSEVLKSFVENIDYDAKGQRAQIDYNNGASTLYRYDPQTFRLTWLYTRRRRTPPPGTATSRKICETSRDPSLSKVPAGGLQNLQFTYDPVGNICHIHDGAQEVIFFNGQVVPARCDYVYDPSYRLIAASGREHIGQLAQPQSTWNDEFRVHLPFPGDGHAMRNYGERYSYDAVGNLERLIHQAENGNWTREFWYKDASLIDPTSSSNRLSGSAVAGGSERYAYDVDGNMTSVPHLSLMEWDFVDRLHATSRQNVSVTAAEHTPRETTFYVYDASGQRVRKVTERPNGSRRSERIYMGTFEIYREWSGSEPTSLLERKTLHILDDKKRVAIVETRTHDAGQAAEPLCRYQFANHVGSACLELDANCDIISYEEYTPYGNTSFQAVNAGIRSAAKRYRYTSKERDEETGFSYFGARYYATWLARWTSCDPVGISDGMNVYSFVHDNPINEVDITGSDGQPWWRFTEAGFQYQTGKHDLFATNPGYDTGFAPANLVVNLVVSASNICTIPFNAITETAAIPEEIARSLGASDQDVEAMNFALMMTGIGEVNALPNAVRGVESLQALRKVEQVAPVVQKIEQAAPIVQKIEQAAPLVQKVEQAAPVVQKIEQAAPLVQKAEQAAPLVQKTEQGVQAAEELASKALKFGKDDLVYGTSSSGKLAALKERAGGQLLSDFLKASGKDVYADFAGNWKAASQWALDQQLQKGGMIRFDLSNVKNIEGVLNGTFKADAVTTFELQYLKANWAAFKDSVVFYNAGKVVKPW
jgi:RHS repeat-associated protein